MARALYFVNDRNKYKLAGVSYETKALGEKNVTMTRVKNRFYYPPNAIIYVVLINRIIALHPIYNDFIQTTLMYKTCGCVDTIIPIII